MKMHEDPPSEISHRAHQAHKLKLVAADGSAPFRCDGCMEPGSGSGRRYCCDGCAFDLHTSCALSEATIKHPLFGDLEFQLLLHPPPSVNGQFCNAFGHATLGFVYHWSEKEKELNLHPCCAALRMETVLQDGHILELCKEARQDCLVCGEKDRPPGSSSHNKKHWWSGKEKLWAYQWKYGGNNGYLHVACMKKIAAQSWEEAYQDSPGGGVVEASVPVMKGMLQWRPSPNSESNAEIGIAGFQIGAGIGDAVSQAAAPQ